MAANRKTKKKKQKTRSKKTFSKKVMPAKKPAKRKSAPKKRSAKKRSAKKRPAQKKAAVETKAVAKRAVAGKTGSAPKRQPGDDDQSETGRFSLGGSRARSGQQSGDLQGLSSVERADSESVDELLEEGNAFEANVLTGVENAGDADEKEVRTHEVPEDDIPAEYLDKE